MSEKEWRCCGCGEIAVDSRTTCDCATDALYVRGEPELFLRKKRERFVSPCPLPTDLEQELLDCLVEECAEVQKRAIKMKRFGVEEVQSGQELTNRARLSLEVGDVFTLVQILTRRGLVSGDIVDSRKPVKLAKLRKYLQHLPEGEDL